MKIWIKELKNSALFKFLRRNFQFANDSMFQIPWSNKSVLNHDQLKFQEDYRYHWINRSFKNIVSRLKQTIVRCKMNYAHYPNAALSRWNSFTLARLILEN